MAAASCMAFVGASEQEIAPEPVASVTMQSTN